MYERSVRLDWSQWLPILKQHGPVVGILLAFIAWQAHWINKLLDRHEKAYTGEIGRMHQQMNKLLEHALGPQASSGHAPRVKDLLKSAQHAQTNPPSHQGGQAS